MYINLPNFVSFLRVPLTFVFFQENTFLRVLALLLAMFTDWLDGYLARRMKLTSQIGSILDPITDKFFVLTIAFILSIEGKLLPWQILALGCRDICVILFGLYLLVTKHFLEYKFSAVFCGKVTTCCQFLVLLTLTLGFSIPYPFYLLFFLLGILSLVELAINHQNKFTHQDS